MSFHFCARILVISIIDAPGFSPVTFSRRELQ